MLRFKCCFVAYAEQRMSGELDNGASNRIILDDDTLLVLRDKNLLIEREWLTLGEIIGKGKQKLYTFSLKTTFFPSKDKTINKHKT